jgi:ubiquitin-protein ligase
LIEHKALTMSSSPRLRRLVADYEALRGEFAGHPNIEITPIGHMPPEGYLIVYRLRGIRLEGDRPVVADEHRVELRLPFHYPREQPVAIPLTPIFHPNVAATYCIADYWSAGQPLADIVRKIGDMIQYRVYNVKSPLDAVAARWVAENQSLFPVGTAELGVAQVEIDFRAARDPRSDER